MNAFTKKISEYAKELELNIDLDDKRAKILFDMDEERSQIVICYYHEAEGHDGFVEISSAVLNLSGFPKQEIGLEMATRLLKENDDMLYCQWAIDRSGDEHYIIATRCWRLDQMDLDEFKGALYSSAQCADALEAELGVDTY